eukprot:Nk52_evm17s1360 gene=Nk52_evmTU17s1360
MDRRRVCGPSVFGDIPLADIGEENGKTVANGAVKGGSNHSSVSKYLLRDSGNDLEGDVRQDGRRFAEMRELFMQTGTVHGASGSAYVEAKNTKVMASVFGPREVKAQSQMGDVTQSAYLTCQVSYAKFSCKNLYIAPHGSFRNSHSVHIGRKEKEFAGIIERALSSCVQLERYPKTVIEVNITVVEDDGCALAHGINAGMLALADSGLHLNDIMCATTCLFVDPQAFRENSGTKQMFLMDPTLKELNVLNTQFQRNKDVCLGGSVSIAYMSSLESVSASIQDGEIEEQSFINSMEYCLDGAAKLSLLMKATLKESLGN